MKFPPVLLTMSFLAAMPAMAEMVRIVNIPAPSLTEVKHIKSGNWVLIEELGLGLPIQAMVAPDSRHELVISLGPDHYKIARADVTLESEALVTHACNTIPLAIPTDARSASVKGAGEICN